MGALHTPVYHGMSKVAATERVFTDMDSNPPLVKAKFDQISSDVRQLRFKPNVELDPHLIDRALVSSVYYGYGFCASKDKVRSIHEDVHRGRRIQETITDKMSDEDVDVFLAQLDQLKSDVGRVRAKIYYFLMQYKSRYDE